MRRSKTGSSPGTPEQVVLFTNGYPYGAGEEFLEAEISHLAAAFGRVLIVPLTNPATASRIRPVPENVTIVEPQYERQSSPHILIHYAAGHPLRALRALARSVSPASSAPRTSAASSAPAAPPASAVSSAFSARLGLHRVIGDFKFLLVSELIADRTIAQLGEVLDPELPTVFYAYWLHAPAQVALTSRARLRMTHAPVVSRAHGFDLYILPEAGRLPPARGQLLRRITRVFPVSEHGRAHLAERFPRYASRFEVERLGVAAGSNAGNPSQEARLVYSCSALIPLKRVPLLARGIAEAQRRGLPLRWVHIGDGPETAFAELRRIADAELAAGSFEFTGALANDDVRRMYAERPGSVLVNCSVSEGVPVSMMEALAQGMPLIATDVGGSSELIASRLGMFDGLLSADPSPAEIADRLERLFASTPAEYAAYVEANLRHWRESWSAERNYRAFCERLKRLPA
ncbi:MAG: glycosyltransferase [Leucobacter sp.]